MYPLFRVVFNGENSIFVSCGSRFQFNEIYIGKRYWFVCLSVTVPVKDWLKTVSTGKHEISNTIIFSLFTSFLFQIGTSFIIYVYYGLYNYQLIM